LNQRGFTLIEVLVALAIVAIGMAAVLSTITSSARTVLFMRDKTLANWVALNHIAEQRLQQPQLPELGNTDGDIDYAGQKWHWRQETVATAVKGMVRMDVMVKPANSKSDDTRGWYVTLSGIMGDAVAQPRGDMPMWDSGNEGPCQPGLPGQPGQPGRLGQPSSRNQPAPLGNQQNGLNGQPNGLNGQPNGFGGQPGQPCQPGQPGQPGTPGTGIGTGGTGTGTGGTGTGTGSAPGQGGPGTTTR